MKILITGATGYLGGAILREALKQDHAIRALCRRKPEPGTLPDGVEIAPGSLLDPDSLTQAAQGCDAVIHSAGLVSIWRRNPDDFFTVNVQGTDNLFEASVKAGVSRIVYTSSFFALGPTDERPVDETWRNDIQHTGYARSKALAHQRMEQWLERGADIVSLYPALIYGPGKKTQGNHITQMTQDFLDRKIPGVLGKGDKRLTFSYVDDVAKGHLLALERGIKGEGYILGGEDASLVELFEMLEEITGIKRPKRRIPYSIAKGIGFMEEIRARLSNHYTPRLTRDVVEVYKHHWRYSSQKAITELNYIRTPLKIGILKTLESLGYAPAKNRQGVL